MKHTFLVAGAVALGLSGPDLATDYSVERTLRIETETTISMETTNFEIVRDGEPMDFGGRGGSGSEETTRSVVLDTTLAHAGKRPTHVRRTFEELSSTAEMSMRGETMELESDCQLAGCTIELVVDDDGDTAIELVEGDEPDDDEALEGHTAALALDALLPKEGVDVGDSWDLEPDAIRRALGVDVQQKLFPRPRPEGFGGGEDGDRGGRGRGRGPGGGGGAGSLFADAEWEGEAKLVSIDDEHDGEPCAVIEVTFSAAGDLPEREWGGGGPRGDRQDGFALWSAAPAAPLRSEYEIEIEGRVFVSIAEKRPLGAEFEGTVLTDTETESTRGERTMVMSMTREGTYERTVTITKAERDSEETDE